MNQPHSPFNRPSKPKLKRQPQNFVEALKSIGGHAVKSISQDLLRPLPGNIIDSATGMYSSPEDQPSPDWDQEWLKQKEAQAEQIQKQLRHQEVITQKVFDRRDEEIKAQIQAIRQELNALAQEIETLAQSTQNAIAAEIEHPGTYHLGFFQILRRFITILRKQVSESQNWLALSYQRRQARNAYWGGFKLAGTKFTLSQERSIATSTG